MDEFDDTEEIWGLERLTGQCLIGEQNTSRQSRRTTRRAPLVEHHHEEHEGKEMIFQMEPDIFKITNLDRFARTAS